MVKLERFLKSITFYFCMDILLRLLLAQYKVSMPEDRPFNESLIEILRQIKEQEIAANGNSVVENLFRREDLDQVLEEHPELGEDYKSRLAGLDFDPKNTLSAWHGGGETFRLREDGLVERIEVKPKEDIGNVVHREGRTYTVFRTGSQVYELHGELAQETIEGSKQLMKPTLKEFLEVAPIMGYDQVPTVFIGNDLNLKYTLDQVLEEGRNVAEVIGNRKAISIYSGFGANDDPFCCDIVIFHTAKKALEYARQRFADFLKAR